MQIPESAVKHMDRRMDRQTDATNLPALWPINHEIKFINRMVDLLSLEAGFKSTFHPDDSKNFWNWNAALEFAASLAL